jgi:hypothetical protein
MSLLLSPMCVWCRRTCVKINTHLAKARTTGNRLILLDSQCVHFVSARRQIHLWRHIFKQRHTPSHRGCSFPSGGVYTNTHVGIYIVPYCVSDYFDFLCVYIKKFEAMGSFHIHVRFCGFMRLRADGVGGKELLGCGSRTKRKMKYGI